MYVLGYRVPLLLCNTYLDLCIGKFWIIVVFYNIFGYVFLSLSRYALPIFDDVTGFCNIVFQNCVS